ncbi:MAG: hypothetical protein KatS3mg002_0222 [Candidatus Woesearchaeota archaeon]|nr:MAG: hypothetical protein KatS3mg002_0222 [Candidatus Woesearchaeota archaeon]
MRKLLGKLILKNNFWGFVFSTIPIEETEELPYIAAVAIKNNDLVLLYNDRLLSQLNVDQIIKILEHEGLHILNKHLTRFIDYIPDHIDENTKRKIIKKLNKSADFATNSIIKDMPKSLNIDGEEYNLLFPEDYGLPPCKSMEWYYENEQEDDEGNHEQSKSSDDRSQNQESFLSSFGGTHDVMGDDCKDYGPVSRSNGNGLSENGERHLQSGSGNTKKELKDITDISHKYWNNETLDTTTAKQIEQKLKAKIGSSYREFKKRRGTLPGYLEEIITEFIEPPKLPYYDMIKKIIKGNLSDKYKRSNTRINKKRVFILDKHLPISPYPGIVRENTFRVVVIVDSSGSMSNDEIQESLKSVKHILNNDKNVFLYLISIDTKINWEGRIRRIDEINRVKFKRGGTTLLPAFERAKELRPHITLCFTDGYCDDLNNFKYKLPKKILYILSENGTSKYIDRTGWIVQMNKSY